MTEILDTIKTWFSDYPLATDLVTILFLAVISYFSYVITRRFGIKILQKIARRSKTKFDDILFSGKTLPRLAYLVPIIIVRNTTLLFPEAEVLIKNGTGVLLIWVLIRAVSAFLASVNVYYETKPISRERPIKGYIQITMIVMYLIAIVFIIGLMTNQSPWVLMSGVGAMTAVVLLIFRDTILSFVAGIQITSYDLLHVGDWIEMPEYGADGDVIDIALHTVRVQNWDKTITVIPTHKLTESWFKNWRGMTLAGGRRIKRALFIDQNSIRICDRQLLQKLEKVHLLKDYIAAKKEELERYNREQQVDETSRVNGRRLTNIGVFRVYAEAYLKNHPKINKNLTLMVRQLPPGPNGLPIEVYAFTNDIIWQNYEAIQADIFDHLLAIVQEFDLRIFQNPSGRDFMRLSGKE